MKRFATAAAALGLVVATAGIAAAERPDFGPYNQIGTQVEVRAGSVLSTKDLARYNLHADDLVSVTRVQAPEGFKLGASEHN